MGSGTCLHCVLFVFQLSVSMQVSVLWQGGNEVIFSLAWQHTVIRIDVRRQLQTGTSAQTYKAMLFVLLEVCVCLTMGEDQAFLSNNYLMSPGGEGGQDDGKLLGDWLTLETKWQWRWYMHRMSCTQEKVKLHRFNAQTCSWDFLLKCDLCTYLFAIFMDNTQSLFKKMYLFVDVFKFGQLQHSW